MSRDVHSCTHWLRPPNSLTPSAFGLVLRGPYWSARRHLFVTPCEKHIGRVTDRLVLAARDEVGAAGMEAHGVHICLVAPESLNAT